MVKTKTYKKYNYESNVWIHLIQIKRAQTIFLSK